MNCKSFVKKENAHREAGGTVSLLLSAGLVVSGSDALVLFPAVELPQDLADAAPDLLDLVPEGGGSHAGGSMAQDNELLRPVGGGHPNPMPAAARSM